MAYTYPAISSFKSYFSRDFTYGTDPSISILDADLDKAQGLAKINFSEAFWSTQADFEIGFNWLTAHYLVMNLRSSSQGTGGTFAWNETSKSVGSVSQSYSIPDRISKDPNFAWLTKTNYGAEYLMLIIPQMTGQVFISTGETLA